MSGIEIATTAAGKAAASSLGPIRRWVYRKTWKRRFARGASRAIEITGSSRRVRDLRRSIRCALTQQDLVDALGASHEHAFEAIDNTLKPHLHELLRSEFGGEWEAHLRAISSVLRDHYFDDLTPQRAIQLVSGAVRGRASDALSAFEHTLPHLVSASLDALAAQGETGVASSLKAWMLEKSNRRSDKVTAFISNPPTLLTNASYFAWEALGHFISSYDLGDPYGAYEMAVRCMSPRSTLLQVDEALRRFNGSNFAEANRLLDRLPQSDALVKLARAIIEDDMHQVLAVLDNEMVYQSEEPRIAQFGEQARVAALMQLGNLAEAIDLARQAMQRYPEYAYWRRFCAHLLCLAAQNESSDGTRRRHLAEEGSQLALEARDMIRRWDGPSGSSLAVALACQIQLRDPQEICRLATMSPTGVATETEAQDSEVIACLAKAYAMLGRVDELRMLDTSGLSEFDSALIMALIARYDDDPNAINLMRAALSLAEGDVERSVAHYGLAMLGGLEDLMADAELQREPSEAALLSSIAASEGNNLDEALALIQPHMRDAPMHAMQYAHILAKQGDVDTAVAHLEEGATRFSAPEMLWAAVEVLIEVCRYDDAEPLAISALANVQHATLRKLLRGQLIEIANKQHNWRKMHQSAVAAAAEFGDEVSLHWAAIYALCNDGESERAFRYFQEHHVAVYDRQSQLVAAGLRSEFDATHETIDWLLDLAEASIMDEEAHATILGAIFVAGRELEPNAEQLARHHALVNGFVQTYPTSAWFRALRAPDFDSPHLTAEDVEAFAAEIRAILEPGSVEKAAVAEKVALGQVPFGMLCAVCEVPYSLLLAECAPGALVAVALDDDIRGQEHENARAALNGTIAVDTSSILMWQEHLGGSATITQRFKELLVPSELLADLRSAERSLRTPTLGSMGFNPATGQIVITESNPSHVHATRNTIGDILASAVGWTYVESANLLMPESDEMPSELAPWDASLRVALHRGCALWIDDVTMRAIARQLGVPAFGTVALYEVLLGASVAAELPSSLDFKRSLIRFRVADVPMTWGEVDAIAAKDGITAAAFIMERPSIWLDPVAALRWIQHALKKLRDRGLGDDAAHLLYASVLGAGRAASLDAVSQISGTLLTAALLEGFPNEVVPKLVNAARAACQKLTLEDQSDPLPVTAMQLLQAINEMFPELEGNHVGGYVTGIFSCLDEADRKRVSIAILGTGQLD